MREIDFTFINEIIETDRIIFISNAPITTNLTIVFR